MSGTTYVSERNGSKRGRWHLDAKTILTVLIIVIFGGGLILQLRQIATAQPAPHFVVVNNPSTGQSVTCVVFGAGTGSCDWGSSKQP